MAEAAVEENAHRFYCHQCTEEINPKLPEFTCPRCDNGFIEEITEEFTESGSSSGQTDIDPAAQFAELWGRAFLESFRHQGGSSQSEQTNSQENNTDSEEEDEIPPLPVRRPHIRPFTRIAVRTGNRQGNNAARLPNLHGLLQLFVDRLQGEMGQPIPVNILPIHGNPGDYVWGSGGLDNIITQLLNQLEGSGSPPAEKEKIEKLPTVKVTQKQVDHILQCSICMEDFKLNEEAKKLPCEHHYHKDCIDTWLNMHGTCPVCRKDLNGEDSTLKQQDDFPPPDMDSNSNSPSGGDNSTMFL